MGWNGAIWFVEEDCRYSLALGRVVSTTGVGMTVLTNWVVDVLGTHS